MLFEKFSEQEIDVMSRYFAVSNFAMGHADNIDDLRRLWEECKIDIPETDDGISGIECERQSWEYDIRKEIKAYQKTGKQGYCLEEWMDNGCKEKFGFKS